MIFKNSLFGNNFFNYKKLLKHEKLLKYKKILKNKTKKIDKIFKKIKIQNDFKNLKQIKRIRFYKKLFFILILFNILTLLILIFGKNGIKSYAKINYEINYKSSKLNEINILNEKYQKEIDLIKNFKMDGDYLDELARKKLNYSKKDEKVIVYKNN